jgi:hypothetical protein
VALKEDDWPLSMVLGVAVGVTVSAVLTVTLTAFDADVYPGTPLSETTAQ